MGFRGEYRKWCKKDLDGQASAKGSLSHIIQDPITARWAT